MNKKSLIILIVSISSFLILIAGVTYAYLKTTAIQSDSNVISTLNCLEVTMEDVSTPITVSEAYPITDEEGLQTTPYRFKLKNLCNIQVGIDINLESLELFPNIIKENFNILKEVGISNYKEIFLNHTHMFLMDPNRFRAIFDKYDPTDLIRCLEKNGAIIEKL